MRERFGQSRCRYQSRLKKKKRVWNLKHKTRDKGDYKYVLKRRVQYETGIVGRACILPFCSLTNEGLLTIEPGYAWDGPSGPTFDTPSFMRGSLVHDCLYQLLRETDFGAFATHAERREQADVLLYEICIKDRMWKWRARWVLSAVRKGGGPAARRAPRKVYEAP